MDNGQLKKGNEALVVQEATAGYRLSVGNTLLLQPGYKQTEVGMIPEDWDYLPIANSIDLLTGFPFSSGGYSNSGIRLLRGSNVKRGVTDWSEDGTEYWSSVTADIRKYVLKSGDIVIAMDGSLVGRSFAMLSDDDVPSLLLQRVARIRSNLIDQKYLKEWICSLRFTEHCDAVKTVSAIPHISPGDIRSFKVVLPPTKAEQEAIAEVLSDTDALIESLDQLIAKKRQIKQGTMQELLAGKKRLPGFSGEWRVTQIGDMLTIAHGKSQRAVEDRNGAYPILATGGQIGTANRFLYDKPSVLIGRKGTIDRPQYMDQPFWTVDTLFYSVIHEQNNAKFLFYRFCLIDWKQYNEASGVPSLNARTIERIEIKVPLEDEQTAIAAILSDMDAEIATLEEKLVKTRALKQGMMHNLLTGRIRLIGQTIPVNLPTLQPSKENSHE